MRNPFFKTKITRFISPILAIAFLLTSADLTLAAECLECLAERNSTLASSSKFNSIAKIVTREDGRMSVVETAHNDGSFRKEAREAISLATFGKVLAKAHELKLSNLWLRDAANKMKLSSELKPGVSIRPSEIPPRLSPPLRAGSWGGGIKAEWLPVMDSARQSASGAADVEEKIDEIVEFCYSDQVTQTAGTYGFRTQLLLEMEIGNLAREYMPALEFDMDDIRFEQYFIEHLPSQEAARTTLLRLWRVYNKYLKLIREINGRIETRTALPIRFDSIKFIPGGVRGPMVLLDGQTPLGMKLGLNIEYLLDESDDIFGIGDVAHEAGHGMLNYVFPEYNPGVALSERAEIAANWASRHLLAVNEVSDFLCHQMPVRVKSGQEISLDSAAHLVAFARIMDMSEATSSFEPSAPPDLIEAYIRYYQGLRWSVSEEGGGTHGRASTGGRSLNAAQFAAMRDAVQKRNRAAAFGFECYEAENGTLIILYGYLLKICLSPERKMWSETDTKRQIKKIVDYRRKYHMEVLGLTPEESGKLLNFLDYFASTERVLDYDLSIDDLIRERDERDYLRDWLSKLLIGPLQRPDRMEYCEVSADKRPYLLYKRLYASDHLTGGQDEGRESTSGRPSDEISSKRYPLIDEATEVALKKATRKMLQDLRELSTLFDLKSDEHLPRGRIHGRILEIGESLLRFIDELNSIEFRDDFKAYAKKIFERRRESVTDIEVTRREACGDIVNAVHFLREGNDSAADNSLIGAIRRINLIWAVVEEQAVSYGKRIFPVKVDIKRDRKEGKTTVSIRRYKHVKRDGEYIERPVIWHHNSIRQASSSMVIEADNLLEEYQWLKGFRYKDFRAAGILEILNSMQKEISTAQSTLSAEERQRSIQPRLDDAIKEGMVKALSEVLHKLERVKVSEKEFARICLEGIKTDLEYDRTNRAFVWIGFGRDYFDLRAQDIEGMLRNIKRGRRVGLAREIKRMNASIVEGRKGTAGARGALRNLGQKINGEALRNASRCIWGMLDEAMMYEPEYEYLLDSLHWAKDAIDSGDEGKIEVAKKILEGTIEFARDEDMAYKFKDELRAEYEEMCLQGYPVGMMSDLFFRKFKDYEKRYKRIRESPRLWWLRLYNSVYVPLNIRVKTGGKWQRRPNPAFGAIVSLIEMERRRSLNDALSFLEARPRQARFKNTADMIRRLREGGTKSMDSLTHDDRLSIMENLSMDMFLDPRSRNAIYESYIPEEGIFKKRVIREASKCMAANLPRGDLFNAAKAVREKILDHPTVHREDTKFILCYLSFDYEVMTWHDPQSPFPREDFGEDQLVESLLKSGKRIAVPVPYYDGTMALYEITLGDLRDGNIERTIFNVSIPKITRLVDKKDIDLAIIPGRAFDLKGYRIGEGVGYFDRFLQSYKDGGLKAPYTIGICYDFQLSFEDLPANIFDIPIDEVITPRGRSQTLSELREKFYTRTEEVTLEERINYAKWLLKFAVSSPASASEAKDVCDVGLVRIRSLREGHVYDTAYLDEKERELAALSEHAKNTIVHPGGVHGPARGSTSGMDYSNSALATNPFIESVLRRMADPENARAILINFVTPDHPFKKEVFEKVDRLTDEELLRRVDECLNTDEREHNRFGFAAYKFASDIDVGHITLRELLLHPTVGLYDISQLLFSAIAAVSNSEDIELISKFRDKETTKNAIESHYLLLKGLEALPRKRDLVLLQKADVDRLYNLLKSRSGVARQHIEYLLAMAEDLIDNDTPEGIESLRNLARLFDRLLESGFQWQSALGSVKRRTRVINIYRAASIEPKNLPPDGRSGRGSASGTDGVAPKGPSLNPEAELLRNFEGIFSQVDGKSLTFEEIEPQQPFDRAFGRQIMTDNSGSLLSQTEAGEFGYYNNGADYSSASSSNLSSIFGTSRINPYSGSGFWRDNNFGASGIQRHFQIDRLTLAGELGMANDQSGLRGDLEFRHRLEGGYKPLGHSVPGIFNEHWGFPLQSEEFTVDLMSSRAMSEELSGNGSSGSLVDFIHGYQQPLLREFSFESFDLSRNHLFHLGINDILNSRRSQAISQTNPDDGLLLRESANGIDEAAPEGPSLEDLSPYDRERISELVNVYKRSGIGKISKSRIKEINLIYEKVISEHGRIDRILEADLRQPLLSKKEISTLDRMRHQLHENAILLGPILRRNLEDIRRDIALAVGNLGEFGLPNITMRYIDKDSIELLLPTWSEGVDIDEETYERSYYGVKEKRFYSGVNDRLLSRFKGQIQVTHKTVWYEEHRHYRDETKYLCLIVPRRLLSEVAQTLKDIFDSGETSTGERGSASGDSVNRLTSLPVSQFKDVTTTSKPANQQTSEPTAEVEWGTRLVDAVKIWAYEAKRRGEMLLLGIESNGWLPDDPKVKKEIQPVLCAIYRLKDELKKRGLDNIEVVHGIGREFAQDVVTTAKELRIPPKNIAVLASADTLDLDILDTIRSTDGEKKAILAEMNLQDARELGYIRFVETLKVLVAMASGEESLDIIKMKHPNIGIDDKQKIGRGIIILLPKAAPLDYDTFTIYDAQAKAIDRAA